MSLRYFGLLILLCLGSHIQAGAAVCSGGGGSDTLPPREISEEKVASKATIMFWNVENLFDTTDDPETEDDEFTPRGQRHWTASRLRTKIHHLATAIVEAGKGDFPPLVALAEVENDSVLEQLSHRSAFSTIMSPSMPPSHLSSLPPLITVHYCHRYETAPCSHISPSYSHSHNGPLLPPL